MDSQGAAAMMNDSGGGGGGGVYNFAEIWPGFQMNANATPYDLGLDPMLTDHGSNRNPRKRRDEDEHCAKGGASTSNSNNGCSSNNVLNEGGVKKLKAVGSNNDFENKIQVEENLDKASKQQAKPAEPPKLDYIHVRARRGQATDSHSLAERARREKISERMKMLQDLVPGCNKRLRSPRLLTLRVTWHFPVTRAGEAWNSEMVNWSRTNLWLNCWSAVASELRKGKNEAVRMRRRDIVTKADMNMRSQSIAATWRAEDSIWWWMSKQYWMTDSAPAAAAAGATWWLFSVSRVVSLSYPFCPRTGRGDPFSSIVFFFFLGEKIFCVRG
ncbi:hypothetical protein MIMGU_mgv1a009933mg [Erythranthe guttata]|uniref:BHLH domain-containing protein n=1 Tax=Erythranthe guttata TaxID=4155 RepID=A0A022Q1M0_ERYGU|nr:hypothetical protein MIMGU_mgv1a009933mg [Erythranthe guttata]